MVLTMKEQEQLQQNKNRVINDRQLRLLLLLIDWKFHCRVYWIIICIEGTLIRTRTAVHF